MEYPIGTKFMSLGKNAYECTIVDILKTYNSNNELVKVGYNATHEFLGQIVTEHNLPVSSIARGIFALEEKLKKD
jgi:hypothetical protein